MRRIYTDEWEVCWKDHQIVVRAWIDSLFRGGQDVIVDGVRIPDENWKSWLPQSSSNVYCTLNDSGDQRELHVHLGRLDQHVQGRNDTGCLILVDRTPIGGDVDKRFKTIGLTATAEPSPSNAYRNLIEATREHPQPSANLPWWVRLCSWIIAHRLRFLLILVIIAYVAWKILFGV